MCNLYSLTKGQAAIRQLFGVHRDLTGNLPPLPGIFPDGMAPVVRTGSDGERELAMRRWGCCVRPPMAGQPVTNIRNTKSPHWRAWLGPKHRCLVPFTSFCEYEDTKPRKTPTWFAGDERRPLLTFAGIWTTWRGVRGTKANPVEGEHQLLGFLTTEANGIVGTNSSEGHAGDPAQRGGVRGMADGPNGCGARPTAAVTRRCAHGSRVGRAGGQARLARGGGVFTAP
jgi:putative SOS response-associated peptidase YedK